MRQALIFAAAAAILAGLSGCAGTGGPGPACMTGTCYDAPETCADCGTCATSGNTLGGGLHSRGLADGGMMGDPACCPCGIPGCPSGPGCLGSKWREPSNPGPPAGAITYPYYTTRGPRDFFASRPRSLGP